MKVGVIGCGFFAQNHLAAWQAIKEISSVIVCDQQVELAEAAKTQFGVLQVYDEAEEMLANEDLDFVDIVTTPFAGGDGCSIWTACDLSEATCSVDRRCKSNG